MPVPLGSLPSGQLISCAEDMAHYLIAHLNGGRYGDVQILFMHLFMPDLSWVARISGGFAGIWVFPCTGLILQALRKSPVTNTEMEDTNL